MTRSRVINGAASLGLVAAFSALVWISVGIPLSEWRASNLAKGPIVITTIKDLRHRVTLLEQERDQLTGHEELNMLWRASQTGQATALIQSKLAKLATTHGINLRSIGPTRSRDLNLAQTSGFRLEMEVGLNQLVLFLRALEHHSPVLIIEKASLRRLNKLNKDQAQPLIFAQIEVSAPVVLEGAIKQ